MALKLETVLEIDASFRLNAQRNFNRDLAYQKAKQEMTKLNVPEARQRDMDNLLTCVTINPAVSQGKQTLRNMRFTVAQLLELLAAGMTNQEILTDYPYLEEADIQAVLL